MTRPSNTHPKLYRWAVLIALAGVVAAVSLGTSAAASDGASAADGTDVAAAAEGHLPALRFVQDEFPLRPRIQVWRDGTKDWGYDKDRGDTLIAKVVVMGADNEAQDVMFGVEDPADHPYRQACYSESDCLDIEVRVNEESGGLYLYDGDWSGRYGYLNDTPTQIVELSAEDSASGLKIYRQAAVTTPEQRPDCDDYPEHNEDRYVCLFLAELLPADAPETSQEMRDALPNLVQDRDNYSLVFAEEFNGNQHAEDSEQCQDGFLTISTETWNFKGNTCERVDANGTPCENIEDGHYRISKIYGNRCGDSISNTFGKMHYKYGYMEVKYTIDLSAASSWKNYAFFGGATQELRHQHDRYGVAVNNMEDFLKNSEVELDHFEYIPASRKDISHQYANWSGYTKNVSTPPLRSNKHVYYCRRHNFGWGIGGYHSNCTSGTVTVTKGIEWTPVGYQTHLKVDGLYDDFTLYPKSKTEIQKKHPRYSNGEVAGFNSRPSTLWGSTRDKYFNQLVPGDSSTEMEQVAVSHIPVEIRIKAWGYPKRHETTVRTNIRIDYVRLYQPADRYAGMEPLYQ